MEGVEKQGWPPAVLRGKEARCKRTEHGCGTWWDRAAPDLSVQA